MESTENVKDRLRALFASQGLAVLATCDGVSPYTSLMSVAVTDDLGSILFVTEEPSRKCSNIENNPDVALLFDDRSKSGERDVAQGLAVTALGKAARIPDDNRQWFLDLFRAKHPHLATFAGSPSSVCFRVTVESWIVVSRFQNVVELTMKGS